MQSGATHRSLGTLELWLEIAAGKLGAASRVWFDEGQCWARIDQIDELACALVAVAPADGACEPVEGRVKPTARLAPEMPPSSAVREAKRPSALRRAEAAASRRKRTAL